MTFAQSNLNALYEVLIGLFREDHFTILMIKTPNHPVYSIYKATHEQASINNHGAMLFQGTTLEVQRYLQGLRDYIIEFKETCPVL